MELSQERGMATGSVAGYQRRLVKKISDRTMADLALEMGVTPAALGKWALMVERAEKTAASVEETFVPASRVRKLEEEIERLKRLLDRNAIALRILEKKGIV